MDKEKIIHQFTDSSQWTNKAKELLENNKDKIDDVKEILRKTWEKIQANKHFKQVLKEAETLISYISDIIHNKYTKHSKWALTVALAALVYVLSPLDIIPDFIPFAGLLDDVVVLTYTFSLLRDELTRYKNWQAGIEDGIIIEEFSQEEETEKEETL